MRKKTRIVMVDEMAAKARFNAETDAKINKMLEEAGIAMPIIPKKFKNMNAKQVYAELKKGE
jgi:flagellar basal body P-ring protein FlgI